VGAGRFVPDGSGQGEDALQDAGKDSGRGVPAVTLEVELTFEGVVDRLDDLPQWLEELGQVVPVRPCGRAAAGWSRLW